MAKKRTKADRLQRQTEQQEKRIDRRPDEIEKKKPTRPLPRASPWAPTEKLVHPLARQTQCRNARTQTPMARHCRARCGLMAYKPSLAHRSRTLGKSLQPPLHRWVLPVMRHGVRP